MHTINYNYVDTVSYKEHAQTKSKNTLLNMISFTTNTNVKLKLKGVFNKTHDLEDETEDYQQHQFILTRLNTKQLRTLMMRKQ